MKKTRAAASTVPSAARRRVLLAGVLLAGVLLATLLVACSGADPGSTPGSESDSSAPVIVTGQAPPEDALAEPPNSVDDAVAQLPELAESVLADSGVPGLAVAVVHDGETVFAEGYGVKKLGDDDPVDADTVFQIASVSKSIGATVVATQVSQDVVAWDTPVARLLPDFELADPYVTQHATIGDFFSHRTGLPLGAGDDLEDIGYGRDYVLEHLVHVPLDSFRDVYHYSNFGVTAGAQATANAAGLPWEELARQELYEPLGMTSTSSLYSDFVERNNRATLHARTGDGFEALYERDADAQSPAGGVSSNVKDLAKWMQLVLADGSFGGVPLIDPDALLPAISAQMFSGHPTAPAQRPSLYGYGFGVGVQPSGRVMLSHSGAFVLGAATTFQMLPSLDVGIVVLTNASPVGAAEALAAQFMDLVQYGTLTRDWLPAYDAATAGYHVPAGDLVEETEPDTPAPPLPLDVYAGVYDNDYFGPATVLVESNVLVVDLGPSDYRLPLEHWDGNTFSFVPTGENAPYGSLSSATFEIEGDKAASMTLAFFNGNGLGSWTR